MTRNIIQTTATTLFAVGCLLAGVFFVAPSAHVSAAPTSTSTGSSTICSTNPVTYDPNKDNACIGTGGVDANGQFNCAATKSCATDSQAKPSANKTVKLITDYANPIINFMAGAVGIFITIQIVIGGIQYSTSADDPGKVSAARSRITNAVIALLAFIFLYTFLQWLTPGGFLN